MTKIRLILTIMLPWLDASVVDAQLFSLIFDAARPVGGASKLFLLC